jgi:GT2 family glycosyltransferase
MTRSPRQAETAEPDVRRPLAPRSEVGRPDAAGPAIDDARERERAIQAERIERAALAVTTLREAIHLEASARRPLLDGLPGDLAEALKKALRGGPRGGMATLRDLRTLRSPGAFDTAFYRLQQRETPGRPAEPIRHYVARGAAEGLDPSPHFSTARYRRLHGDVTASGVNAYAHWLRHGRAEGRRASASAHPLAFAFGESMNDAARRFRVFPPNDPEGREPHLWPARDRTPPLRPEDRRPDDLVLDEAARGDAFLTAHGLLDPEPRFASAVEALNRLAADSVLVGEGGEERPSVSIVVPVYGQLAYTLNCLDALLRQRSARRFEVIVMDDVSPDATGEVLSAVERIRYRRQAENQGFVENCNAGAAIARGDIVVMLNNDTRVVEGWLDALVDGLERLPEAGLVGSKLFYPDGSLQEAGGIVWRDGSAWNYGRNDDPNRPRYCYAREVDYVSGASIALPMELWRRLGGFDAAFRPAYYEDNDLAFRVREAGLKAWLQPLSRVIHYEGKTSGTDLTQGAKAYQVANQKTFYARWAQTLARHRENGIEPWLERERGVNKRVLVIDITTPTPDQDAGSVVTDGLIALYQRLGFKVSYLPIGNYGYDPVYTARLQARGVECLYHPYVSDLDEHLAVAGADYDVVQVFRFEALEQSADLIRAFCPKAKIVFHNQDCHFLRLERQAALEGSAAMARHAAEIRVREWAAMEKADVVMTLSTVEKALFEAEALSTPVRIMPYLVEAPPETAAEPGGRKDIVFLGGFGHPPNKDAVEWFVHEVWPTVRARAPEARFVIVGAKPPPEIKALGDERLVVTGRVDELSPYMDQARVFVAPLRFGAGVKGKLYAALSAGAPVVSTSVGAEGMGLQDGQEALIADGAEAFAQAVLRVWSDDALWRLLSEAGRTFVRNGHTSDAGLEALQSALDAISAKP